MLGVSPVIVAMATLARRWCGSESDARKNVTITHNGQGVFRGRLPVNRDTLPLLIVDPATLPECLRSPPGAKRRRLWAFATASGIWKGRAVPPESILSEQGHALLKNFRR